MTESVCTHPNVTFARKESLRNASGVKAGSGDVESSHEEEPAHLAHGGGPQEALSDHKVQCGNHSTQPQTNKHTLKKKKNPTPHISTVHSVHRHLCLKLVV